MLARPIQTARPTTKNSSRNGFCCKNVKKPCMTVPCYDAAFSFGVAPGLGRPIFAKASVRTSFKPSLAS
ncbi:hypothetical protein ACVWZ3_006023 [Bradyrhizobium sp. i1.3.6]